MGVSYYMDSYIKIAEPWEDPKDLMDRKKYADFLTQFLVSKDEPFVLNLNAGWGFGKTFFLRSWAESIKEKHPVVYINAWENDFSDDPLLAVMSSINTYLKGLLNDNAEAKAAIKEVIKSSGRLIKQISSIIAKGLLQKALGGEATDQAQTVFESAASESVANFAELSAQKLLEDHQTKSDQIEQFRISLGKLIDSITKKGTDKQKPVFIFIDELDRCRPTYAIELLENVKHLFSVKGAVFVIATDSSQLQHSIKSAYGEQFDGAEYLRRFFSMEFVLPEPNYEQLAVVLSQGINYADRFVETSFLVECRNGNTAGSVNLKKCNQLDIWLAFFAKSFQISPRTFYQVFNQLNSILVNSSNKWHLPFLLYLIMLNARDGKLFKEMIIDMKRNHLDLDKIKVIPQSNESIRWSRGYRHSRNGPRHNDEFLIARSIGISYLSTIVSSYGATKSGIKCPDSTIRLDDFVKHSIWYQADDPSNDQEIFDKYFDAISLAGCLQ